MSRNPDNFLVVFVLLFYTPLGHGVMAFVGFMWIAFIDYADKLPPHHIEIVGLWWIDIAVGAVAFCGILFWMIHGLVTGKFR